MTNENPHDDAFVEKIAEVLRAPERADATFEARAMSAVHATDRARTAITTRPSLLSWWTRPRTFYISPLGSLPLAAALVALLFAPWMLTRRATPDRTVAARADTVHVVRFVLVSPNARKVTLVGGFNQWDQNATPLHTTGTDSVWTVSVPLSSGQYEYNFVVEDQNGVRWVADPLSNKTQDEFGTESSVIFVGGNSAS